MVDLANERLGGRVLYATDEFFAEKENLLEPHKPVWKEHEYTSRGKWMDGWESRRKRTPGHDYVIVRLGAPGVIRGVVVDTSYFRGNFPEACSIDLIDLRPDADLEALLKANWTEALPRSPLKGDSENRFPVEYPYTATHVRFNIYPDGGVARLRIHGLVIPDWRRLGGLSNEIDLAALEHGGEVLECSDMFFGPKHNLIMPGSAINMSDGWETRRRRGPGNDWVVVKLGVEGVISRVEIDTTHFKGNYPDTASLEGFDVEGFDIEREKGRGGEKEREKEASNSLSPTSSASRPLAPSPSRPLAPSPPHHQLEILPRTKLQPDTRHLFNDELQNRGPFTYVRLNVFPDGGVARLRIFGRATEKARAAEVARRLNSLDRQRAAQELFACCASTTWANAMLKARPFTGWDDLAAKADRTWAALSKQEILEAFRAHPRIGERSRGWTAQEQSGVTNAGAFRAANQDYEKRFGHIYIVCATGKSGDEIMANLRERMANSPEQEFRTAAAEQQKITKLRLQKLVS